MDAPVLELLGPFPAWGESVHRARWSPPGRAPRHVVAVLGPEHDDPHALQRARERARPWIDRAPPGVLPLLSVEEIDGRTAWLYEPAEGISLGLVVEDIGEVPLRAAAELVARVADTLEAAGPQALHHPGPRLDELLIDEDARVWVAGFVGPYPRGPAWREPTGADDAPAAVWRLGVLLAQLLTGSAPQSVTDPTTHEAALRRLLIRIMSRPGPVFPERYRDWLCGMLAWDPLVRPVLHRVADGLRQASASLPEPGLGAWARAAIPPVRRRTSAGDPIRTPEPPLESGAFEVAPPPERDRTEEISALQSTTLPGTGPGPLPEHDDETAISTPGAQPRGAGLEHGTIPVKVGPPPEAVPKRASLPTGLFDEDEEETGPTEVMPRRSRAWPALAGTSVVLVIVGVLLALYLYG